MVMEGLNFLYLPSSVTMLYGLSRKFLFYGAMCASQLPVAVFNNHG